ncbi:MAG TPA: tetratricopeptide repeat protein [Tepidisphaeraceae bacterium]|jgi:Flp pilus assembly protein TadD
MTGLTTPQLIETAVGFHRAGKLSEANAFYLQALDREPNRVDLLRLLARVAHEQGRSADAAGFLRRAIELVPGDASLLVNLGMVLVALGDLENAIASLRKATDLNPKSPEALSNLGAALRQRGDYAEAASVLRRAVTLKPDFAHAIVNLGAVLTNLDQFDDAITALLRAIALRPEDALAHYNLGVALKSAGHLEQALESLNYALKLQPNEVDTIINIGDVLQQLSRYDQAIDFFNAALELSPHDPAARTNLSMVLLLKEKYRETWPLYEARLHLPNQRKRYPYPQPKWDGASMPGKRILLHWEQGLGDTLQFIRYAPLVAERGLEVIFLCQGELRRLITGQCRIAQVITESDPLPSFDVYCPLLSLPGIFDTALDTIPLNVPYLHADPALIDRWLSVLCADPPARLKIGINWAGSPLPLSNRKRTVGLSAMAPLARIPGAQFYSLQKGPPAADAKTPPAGMELIDHSADLTDFAETAALMSCLDRVITCDTSIAHAAGALGVATHVLLPFNPDWRWHLNRSDSPWYPTLRLHRQPAPGDYNTPIQELVRQLSVPQEQT